MGSHSLPAPGFVTVAATRTSPASSRLPSVVVTERRIDISIPAKGNCAADSMRNQVMKLAQKHIRAKLLTHPCEFLVESSFLSTTRLDHTAAAGFLDHVAEASPIRPVRFHLAPSERDNSLPSVPPQAAVSSYSLRVCPPDSSCSLCEIHDRLYKENAITLSTPLLELLQFGIKLTAAGFREHSPSVSVFRPPEDSTPVSIDEVPPKLRDRIQKWFDNHAANPPTFRPTARSPLYNYDACGGVLPRWSSPPSRKVFSRTAPNSQQRFVLYKEMLKDLVFNDLELIDIADIKASCAVFVAFHPQTGKPRPCASPFEANELTPPAPVRYGNARDLFAVPGVSSGVRLDFKRGFKHIPLAKAFAIYVAFVLDGVGLLPRSVFFGLRDGPLIFCSTLAEDMKSAPSPPPPPGAFLSPRVSWVDDVAQLGHPPAFLVEVFFAFITHMAKRGWKFGIDKCFLLPCVILRFIGILLEIASLSFCITKDTAQKLALWALKILTAASTDAGEPVTPLQHHFIQSHMGRLSWVSSIGLASLSFARSRIDMSLSAGSWVPGAREVLIHHARAAESWTSLRVSVAPHVNAALLTTDASVSPSSLEVSGSGFFKLPSQTLPTHFSCVLTSSDLADFGFTVATPKPSSTWAEAATAAIGACILDGVIQKAEAAGTPKVDAVAHTIDSKTVASRAALCSASDYQCSALYLFIQSRSARTHTFTWISRSDDLISKADAGSTAASGLWRLVEPVRQIIERWAPDLDITADFASTTAQRYSSPHHPADSRLANLLTLSGHLSSAPAGFLGAPGFAPWNGLRVFGCLLPSYTAALPDVSRVALSSPSWSALILVVLSPDILAVLASWLDAGIAFHAAATPCSSVASPLIAPDGRRPRHPFPTRLISISRGPQPSQPHLPAFPHWCTVVGPLIRDRHPSAQEAITAWIRSGQCPHPGPPRTDPSSLLPSASFATAVVAAQLAAAAPPPPPHPSSHLSAGLTAFAAAALPSLLPSPATHQQPATLPPAAAAVGRSTAPVAALTPSPASHPASLRVNPILPHHPPVGSAPPRPVAGAASLIEPPPRPSAPVSPPLRPSHTPPSRPAPAPSRVPVAAPDGRLRLLPLACSSSQASSPAPSLHSSQPPHPPRQQAQLVTPAAPAASAVTPAPASAAAARGPDAPSPAPATALPPSHSPDPAPAAASASSIAGAAAVAAAPTSARRPRTASAPARSARTRRAASASRPPPSSKRRRETSAEPPGPRWVDAPVRCGQCHNLVRGDSPALLCDEESCSGWLVCTACIPHDPDVPLLCPLHQLAKHRESMVVKAGLAMALDHKHGSLGRLLGCLTAWVGSEASGTPKLEMASVLARAPIIESAAEALLPPQLRSDAAQAERSLWNDDRRNRSRAMLFKMTWLATKLAALDAPFHIAITPLAKAYVRHRLSPDRPPGWRKAGPEHTATELSALARIMEDLELPIAPYLGARRVLDARGAFLKKEHSPRWPIPPFRVFEKAAAEPRPIPAARQRAIDALQWHAVWGVRPGYLWRIEKAHFRQHLGGFIFRWNLETKVKRGDREADGHATLKIPQLAAARHTILSEIWPRQPDEGPMFADAKDDVPPLVREWFGDEVASLEDFALAHAGIRNGVDMALQIMGLPPDYIDAHLWWARNNPRMRAYYAGLQIGLAFYATERLHLIKFRPLAPGWYEVISKPPTPCWEEIPPLDAPAALPTETPMTIGADLAEADALGPVPCQAPPAVSGAAATRRRRHAASASARR